MYKTATVLLIIFISLALLAGCNKDEKTIMADFDAMIENATTTENIEDMAEFLDANIKNVDKATATDMVVKYREYLLNYILQNKDKAILQGLDVYMDENTGHIDEEKIKNSESKDYLDQITASSLMVITCDEVPGLRVDYGKLLDKYGDYISEPIKALYLLEGGLTENPTWKNAKLQVNWQELLNRTFAAERLLTDFPQEEIIAKDALWIYKAHLNAVLMGTTNSPVFDYTTKEFSKEAKKTYKEFIASEPDSVLTWALKEYFIYLDTIDYSLDFNDSAKSKDFFDTCDRLLTEAEKRVRE